MDLITGNRFLEMSDLEFSDTGLRPKNDVSNGLVIDKLIGNRVFCETHKLNDFFKYINDKPKSSHYYILISHNSDGCIVPYKWRPFDFQFVERNIPSCIIAWYAQNMDVLSSRIRPLPIGLENFKWHKGRKWQELTQVSTQKISRTQMVFMNFEVSTNPSERNMCFNALRSKPFVTRAMEKKSYLKYLTEMKRHYFALCPEGNGFDTHRLWEALYLGCIPIVRKRIFTQIFSRLFPMVLIEHWEEVTLERLKPFISNKQVYLQKMEEARRNLNFSVWEKIVRGEIKI